MEVGQQLAGEALVQFLNGPLAGQRLQLKPPVITIGRDPQNDIVVSDPRISRRHACIRRQRGLWQIENLSQASYIAIDQQRTAHGILQNNTVIHLGSEISFVFTVQSSAASGLYASQMPGQAAPTPIIPAPELPGPLPRIGAETSPTGTVLAPISKNQPSLSVSTNTHSETQTHVLDKQVIDIGRHPQNDIVIEEPTISAWHVQIVRDGEELVIMHPSPRAERGSTLNGLWYQGQRTRGNATFRKVLQNGDTFRVGDDHGTLISLVYSDGSGLPVETTMPALPPVPLTGERLTIGRAPGNTLVLNHPQVSARHAVVEKIDGGYRIVDANSTNHVFVNGQRTTTQMLRTGDEIRVGPYRLTYTGTELKQFDESSNIRIDALHLKKVGNNNVILLNDISLAIPPRKFVALVGGSGAGKSTLMDALNGLRPAQEGLVLYNGEDYYRNLAAFNTQLGYVPQDDIVHRDLTVEHALYYAARLRLPRDFTREQIQWRIDEVLEDVEMTERRDLLVSKLSGGQRKRVSIALELLANPSVFFLDEPTSGLDPGLDRKMMSLLRRLADKGHTIVLVTHATNNINSCDYVCFLAQNGRLAYFGPPNNAKSYFEKTDFAEIYSSLESNKEQPNIPEEAEARFRASPDYQQYVAIPLREGQIQQARKQSTESSHAAVEKNRRALRGGHGWSQFFLLSQRYVELLKNDVGNLMILLLQAPLIAIVLVLLVRSEIGMNIFNANQLVQCRTQLVVSSGQQLTLPQAQQGQKTTDCQNALTFLQSNPQGQSYVNSQGGLEQALQNFLLPGQDSNAQTLLFVMAFATVLFGCINGSREIVKEAPIYRRERAVNLGILPYMFSKIFVLGVLCLLQSLVLVLIVEIGEPLKQGIILPPFLEVYITLCLSSLAGLMIGLAISSVASSNDRAISLVPIVLIPQVIFSGTLIPLQHLYIQVIAGLFPTRWAMAALGSSLGLHSNTLGKDSLINDDPTYHGTLFSIYSHSDAVQRLIVCWVALGALTVALMIVVGFFLKRKDIRG
ncbi:MAG TPA: FHA domain-containing protein [Ktedonobacteraceae bacterium]|nr:FHA domain-containing protein [Ktedonobacteraceae bacterium]